MAAIDGLVGSIWERKGAVIPASSTATVFSKSSTSFHCIKVILTGYNDVEGKNKSLEMLINRHKDRVFGYINNLRSQSQGRANYTMQFDHYEPVPAAVAQEVKESLGA